MVANEQIKQIASRIIYMKRWSFPNRMSLKKSICRWRNTLPMKPAKRIFR